MCSQVLFSSTHSFTSGGSDTFVSAQNKPLTVEHRFRQPCLLKTFPHDYTTNALSIMFCWNTTDNSVSKHLFTSIDYRCSLCTNGYWFYLRVNLCFVVVTCALVSVLVELVAGCTPAAVPSWFIAAVVLTVSVVQSTLVNICK